MTDTRQPTGFATYPGDCRNILTEGGKGANHMGEMMYPVTAEYDSDQNQTRVGFSLISPPQDAP